MSGSQEYLQAFLSNSQSYSTSISGPLTDRMSINVLASRYRVTGGYPAKSDVYSITMRRRMSSSLDIEAGVERQNFIDEIDPKNTFRATMLIANLRSRF
jgi:hypothetical protein